MAKKTKKSNETLSLYAASEELARQLIKLYKAKTFVRSGKDLAELLFKSGIEAGSFISGISELSDRQAKIDAANQAILKLNQTMYVANVMQVAEYYTLKQVKPLIQYIGMILNALRDLLNKVPETQRVIRVVNPVDVVHKNAPVAPAVQTVYSDFDQPFAEEEPEEAEIAEEPEPPRPEQEQPVERSEYEADGFADPV